MCTFRNEKDTLIINHVSKVKFFLIKDQAEILRNGSKGGIPLDFTGKSY
jgi:hypothetical protein